MEQNSAQLCDRGMWTDTLLVPVCCWLAGLQELLVPVPSAFFQGSLLLGSITRAALGAESLARADVLLSPLAIAGWCGLITNAFNLLPVGSLDGGRMMQVGGV